MKTGIKLITFFLFIGSIIFIASHLITWLIPALITLEASYAELPPELMVTEADLIFAGEVQAISDSRWNQDSGDYWVEGLPYHQVTFFVTHHLKGNIEKEVVVTILGNNPSESITAQAVMPSPHTLQIGDEALIFARQTTLTWRGEKSVLAIMLLGNPATSIALKTGEGYQTTNGMTYNLVELSAELNR